MVLQLGVRRLERDARFEPADDLDEMNIPPSRDLQREAQPHGHATVGEPPEIRPIVETESGGDDADHGMSRIADPDDSTDYAGIAAEPSLPEAGAQHDEAAQSVIVGVGEEPADFRPGPEHREERGGHANRRDPLRLTGAGDVDLRPEIRRQVVKRGDVVPPVEKVSRRDEPRVVSRHRLPHRDQTVSGRIWQGPNEDPVGDAEDSGRGADAERERGEGGNQDRRLAQERTDGVAELEQDRWHKPLDEWRRGSVYC